MRRAPSPIKPFAVTAILAVLLGGWAGSHAQEPELAGDGLNPFAPTALQEGTPLPGEAYPKQPVSRAAPGGWADSAPPQGFDLDVTYIERSPMYKAYCVEYLDGIPTLCPGTEDEQRWPSPEELVTFTAHVVNKGTEASPPFGYKWTIDGGEVAVGSHSGLAPADETTLTYYWPWAHSMDGEQVLDDHTIGFVADPNDALAETYETNNSLEDRTNALGFRLAITPEMYEAYNTPWDPSFSYSAEDWLQRQVAAMNWAFANSTYPTTPNGATERVRINSIEITSSPPANDRSHDGGWFVDADYRIVSGGYDPVADVDWNLVHELSHQVGLIDLYNLNIATTSVKALDSEGIPANFGFDWPRPGLMGGGDIAPHTDPHLYSSHSAGGISATKGFRRGYYGEYQFDIPKENYLLVLNSEGNPASDVEVALYQRNGPPNWVGELEIDDDAEITGTTGPDGRLLLTNRPVAGGVTTATGHMLRDNPFGVVDLVGNENRVLIRLSKGDHEEFAWTDITAFNLAFWQGNTFSHTLVLDSHVPPLSAPTSPEVGPAQIEANQATFCWDASPSPGVTGYYVYRAAPPTYAYEQASGLVTDLCYTEAHDTTRIYAVTAVDGDGRESGFSNFTWAPRLLHPHATGITSDGLRTILDPQNGYALLRQQGDGRYLQNVGSVHYHLENSQFLDVDAEDHLLFSHPGDYYTDRHSVRIADRDAEPILEFGERGTAPGEFETPAGVATVGQACTIEGPYAVDEHTLLLLRFDGSYGGAQGEPGTPEGTTFAPGRYDQGVEVDSGDTLTYASAGNLERTQGAVEFWIQPTWDGGDGQSYTLFEVGDEWFNRLRVAKDGVNNLRLMVWDSTSEYGVAYNVAHWAAGEWHHVAATWEGNSIALYTDGEQRDSSDSANVPDRLADTLYIGSSLWHDQQADAVLDELRISDIPRVGSCPRLPYRFLVADSGNHRIQAFDELGNFVRAYGSFGSGPGQFDQPQGLAAEDPGLVVVADTNNDRLQLLSFDGARFGFRGIILAGFDGPVGVALYGEDHILVADTGNNRIAVLDGDGTLLAEYAGPNDGHMGPFDGPRGVLGADGNIVVADTGNARVVSILGVLPTWFEEDDPAISYSGAWKARDCRRCGGGALTLSPQRGATAMLAFTGTGIRWYASTGHREGIARVYVDGVYRGPLDLYSPTPAVGVVWERLRLPPGPHTFTIEVSGRKNPDSSGIFVNVDLLEVIP